MERRTSRATARLHDEPDVSHPEYLMPTGSVQSQAGRWFHRRKVRNIWRIAEEHMPVRRELLTLTGMGCAGTRMERLRSVVETTSRPPANPPSPPAERRRRRTGPFLRADG